MNVDKPAARSAARPTGAAAFAARQAGGPRRKIGLGFAAAALMLVGGLGAAGLVAGSGAAERAEHRPDAAARIADLERQRATRSAEIAELDRRRGAQASEFADNARRLAELRKRRDALESEVAALTAPLSDPDRPAKAHPEPTPSESVTEGEPNPGPAPTPASARPAEAAGPTPIAKTPVPMPVEREKVASSGTANGPALEAVAAKASGAVRVFIHVRSGDRAARVRAQALADDLRSRGVEVAGIRGVPHAVRGDLVRFFYDADESAVPALESALQATSRGRSPLTQDFRDRRVAPKQGTLEIWLS